VKGVRKRTLLTMVGLAILGLISGLFAYGPVKEKGMESKKSIARAAEPAAAGRPLGASSRKSTETATFAMG
jgi:hypothetical protein